MKLDILRFAIVCGLVMAVAACGDQFEQGDQVWVSPGGLGAHAGTWQVTEPWAEGMVVESKGGTLQVQIQRAETAGRDDLKEMLRPGALRWFSEDALAPIKTGKAAFAKRQVAYAALSKALSAFGRRGEVVLAKESLESALRAAQTQNNDKAALALEILRAGTDKARSPKARVAAIRKLLVRDDNAKETAGRLLAAWVADKAWNRRMSSLNFSRDRRRLVVQPGLGKSVPGTVAGAIAIAIYEQLDSGLSVFPERKMLEDLEEIDLELWGLALDSAPKKEAPADKSRQLNKLEAVKELAAESHRIRLERLRIRQLQRMENQLQQYIDENALTASDNFRVYWKTQREHTEKESRHWALTGQDMTRLVAKAEQVTERARKKEEERLAREAKEREIKERNRKLIAQLEKVTARFIAALKRDDFATVCKIADSIPVRNKKSEMMSNLERYFGDIKANAFAPKFVRLHRYEEYTKQAWGSDAVAEVDLAPAPDSNDKRRLQFRQVQGEWRLYSGFWWKGEFSPFGRSGDYKYMDKPCKEYLAKEQ